MQELRRKHNWLTFSQFT